MEVKFSFEDILSLIALVVALLYNFQILTLKNRTQANRFFSFYLFNITFIILFFFLLNMNLSKILKYFAPILILSELMLPINLWVYLRKITQINEKKKYFKHYLTPLIASALILVILVLAAVAGSKEAKDVYSKLLLTYAMFLMTFGFLILNAIYLTFSFILFFRHQKTIRNYYSYTQKVDLQWVKVMLFAYVFLLIGLIISNLSSLDWTDHVFYGVLIIFIIFIGHNALRQRNIWIDDKKHLKFSNKEEEIQEFIEENQGNEPYTEAQLELFKMLKESLIVHMEKEKPYLDQDLSILKLARDLNTNTKYLSYVINSEFKQNFINFINDYRIEEVKNNLTKQNTHFTIEALGQNAGFKSKSSFNAAFKKSTGITPSIFMKENLN